MAHIPTKITLDGQDITEVDLYNDIFNLINETRSRLEQNMLLRSPLVNCLNELFPDHQVTDAAVLGFIHQHWPEIQFVENLKTPKNTRAWGLSSFENGTNLLQIHRGIVLATLGYKTVWM